MTTTTPSITTATMSSAGPSTVVAPAGAPELPKIQFPIMGVVWPATRLQNVVDEVRIFHFLDEQSTQTGQRPT